MGGGRGREILSWLGWRGRCYSAWQFFLAQTSEQCLTLDGVLLWVAMGADRDPPFTRTSPLKCCGSETPLPLSSPGKHGLCSSSFQLHERGVICELARVLHN